MFVRGNRALCASIKRTKVKGNGPRKPGNPETEPDFYAAHFSAPAADPRAAHAQSVLGCGNYAPANMGAPGPFRAPHALLPTYNPTMARALLGSVFPEASGLSLPLLPQASLGLTMDVRSALAISRELMGSQHYMMPIDRVTNLDQTADNGDCFPKYLPNSEAQGKGA